jgi:hypothetical protein
LSRELSGKYLNSFLTYNAHVSTDSKQTGQSRSGERKVLHMPGLSGGRTKSLEDTCWAGIAMSELLSRALPALRDAEAVEVVISVSPRTGQANAAVAVLGAAWRVCRVISLVWGRCSEACGRRAVWPGAVPVRGELNVWWRRATARCGGRRCGAAAGGARRWLLARSAGWGLGLAPLQRRSCFS